MNGEFPLELLRPSLIKIIEAQRPELLKEKMISKEELDVIKKLYFKSILEKSGEDPNHIEEIVNSLVSNKFLADNANIKHMDLMNLGDRIAGRVSNFLGSWKFIFIIFFLVIFWVIFSMLRGSESFDPYPFALLGFLLTGLSALQAPFILNSQKNQSDRETIKFDEDYQTNLKSEFEIRNLHSKIDHYNRIIWEKLEKIEKKN